MICKRCKMKIVLPLLHEYCSYKAPLPKGVKEQKVYIPPVEQKPIVHDFAPRLAKPPKMKEGKGLGGTNRIFSVWRTK